MSLNCISIHIAGIIICGAGTYLNSWHVSLFSKGDLSCDCKELRMRCIKQEIFQNQTKIYRHSKTDDAILLLPHPGPARNMFIIINFFRIKELFLSCSNGLNSTYTASTFVVTFMHQSSH